MFFFSNKKEIKASLCKLKDKERTSLIFKWKENFEEFQMMDLNYQLLNKHYQIRTTLISHQNMFKKIWIDDPIKLETIN